MKENRIGTLVAIAAIALVSLATPAVAGPYGDTLSKCLVSKTTSAEKTTLVRWMFAMIALHPDVQGWSTISDRQRDDITKRTAKLFENLLTETCGNETREAIKYEGFSTIESSFSVLGSVATRELFTNEKVSAGLEQFGKAIDGEKLKKTFGVTK